MESLASALFTSSVLASMAVATAVLLVLVLGAGIIRRRRLSGLHTQAAYLFDELSRPRWGIELSEVASDYDAVAFQYNVLQTLPLSRLFARHWPMLAWAHQVAQPSGAMDEPRPPQAGAVEHYTGQVPSASATASAAMVEEATDASSVVGPARSAHGAYPGDPSAPDQWSFPPSDGWGSVGRPHSPYGR